MVEPNNSCASIDCDGLSECQHTIKVKAIQVPVIFSIVFVDWNGKILEQKTFSGNNCADEFIIYLLKAEERLEEVLEANKPMRLTPEEDITFLLATHCHICEGPFLPPPPGEEVPKGYERVRDHCHLSGKLGRNLLVGNMHNITTFSGDFLGASHSACNLRRRVVQSCPLYCHNFSNYDS